MGRAEALCSNRMICVDFCYVQVPETICNLVTLQNLNISHNAKILVLPNIMGRLKDLSDLKLGGNEISDPPPEFLKNTRKCISYLRQRLLGCEPYYRMKLMVVGYAGRGEFLVVITYLVGLAIALHLCPW